MHRIDFKLIYATKGLRDYRNKSWAHPKITRASESKFCASSQPIADSVSPQCACQTRRASRIFVNGTPPTRNDVELRTMEQPLRCKKLRAGGNTENKIGWSKLRI